MQAVLYTNAGKETGTIELENGIFACKPNLGLIHRLLVLQQANARIAIAHTKTRGGTGQARAGDSRSPTRMGG
jgi:large subunit ribosomal protein L4